MTEPNPTYAMGDRVRLLSDEWGLINVNRLGTVQQATTGGSVTIKLDGYRYLLVVRLDEIEPAGSRE